MKLRNIKLIGIFETFCHILSTSATYWFSKKNNYYAVVLVRVLTKILASLCYLRPLRKDFLNKTTNAMSVAMVAEKEKWNWKMKNLIPTPTSLRFSDFLSSILVYPADFSKNQPPPQPIFFRNFIHPIEKRGGQWLWTFIWNLA